MISNYYGTVIKGSTSLLTSVANAEIIPDGFSFVDFELFNDQICHISINGGDYIYIRASQGIKIDSSSSIKIQEAGITFTWIGLQK